MPLPDQLRRVVTRSIGAGKVALGATLGDLRLEQEGRKQAEAMRLPTPVEERAPETVRRDRRAQIREEIRREREQAARVAAEA